MEEELNPIVAQVLAGVVTIVGALVVSRLMSRYINKKLEQMDRKRLLEMEVPKP